jgi:RNA polymerase sigma-70 factor (ECF subfamily)
VETDATLVAAYRDRADQDAFTELVRRYREPVFRLAVSILGAGFAGDAEEVTQEVFLRVHSALDSFRGDAQFSSWIYRIAFNLALNLKARVRYRAPHLGEEVLSARAAPRGDPVGRMALEAAIEELPEIYQSALRLHYWMGSSIEEIAELIGVPENTVKSYLHRARRLLYGMLEKEGPKDV